MGIKYNQVFAIVYLFARFKAGPYGEFAYQDWGGRDTYRTQCETMQRLRMENPKLIFKVVHQKLLKNGVYYGKNLQDNTGPTPDVLPTMPVKSRMVQTVFTL